MKFDSRKDQQRLAAVVDRLVNETNRFAARGLWFCTTRLEVVGRPPRRIRLWSTLHFLTKGSPFLCPESRDYVWNLIIPELSDEFGEAIRRHLSLRDSIAIELVEIQSVVTEGVRFELFTGRTLVPADINERDELGRTALWRAAVWEFARQFEELLAAGADVSIPGPDGRTLEGLLAANRLEPEIACLLELHLARSGP